jgi:hypothetical protein
MRYVCICSQQQVDSRASEQAQGRARGMRLRWQQAEAVQSARGEGCGGDWRQPRRELACRVCRPLRKWLYYEPTAVDVRAPRHGGQPGLPPGKDSWGRGAGAGGGCSPAHEVPRRPCKTCSVWRVRRINDMCMHDARRVQSRWAQSHCKHCKWATGIKEEMLRTGP